MKKRYTINSFHLSHPPMSEEIGIAATPPQGRAHPHQAGRRSSPVFFLTAANVLSAVIGLVASVMTARWLGEASYGVMGVIWGVNATVLSFVDPRLTDLMVKRYYQPPPPGVELLRHRANVLQVTFISYFGLAVCAFLLGAIANLGLIGLFTAQPVKLSWIAAGAFTLSSSYLLNPLTQMHRLQGRFYFLGLTNLATTLVLSGTVLGWLYFNRSLDGFYTGSAVGAFTTTALFLTVSAYLWTARDRLPLFQRLHGPTLTQFKRNYKFLFWSNTLGYVKMGHRAADILFVGLLTNDQLTGVYKLARSLTDKLYYLFDATNQVYQPDFMQYLAAGQPTEYRRLARRLLSWAGLATGAIVAVELAGYPLFQHWLLAGKFAGSQAAVVILTLPLFLVLGGYLWIWPIILHHNLLRSFTVLGLSGVVAQYAVGWFLFTATGLPAAFPIGYLTYYLVLIGGALLQIKKLHPRWLPGTFYAHP
ncbi:MAG: lipopolysaccharide biosynthesis protein [bacterium]|nr:lipopolysaccharide biosynthesis protein [bacterium]